MKILSLVIAASILIGTFTPSAQAREPVSMEFFYDNLEPHGSWREVGNYGYCWQPHHVEDGWRPYSDGRWVYTDAGWTWDSDEPYGWAVYHYGRWANVARVGWVWVPGTEWGPGWVSWRRSPRYVGWAPLPPEALFLRAFGFSSWVDAHYDIGPSSYRFVEGRNFGARHLRSAFIDQRENISIIHQTTNITNISYVNNVVHNGGLEFDEQSRLSSEPLQRYKLERRDQVDGDPRKQKPDQLRANVAGDSLSVFAPPVAETATATPRNLAKKVTDVEVDRGWENAGTAADIAAMRGKLQSKVSIPDKLPPQAKFGRPASKSPTAGGAPLAEGPIATKKASRDKAIRDESRTAIIGDRIPAPKPSVTNEPPAAVADPKTNSESPSGQSAGKPSQGSRRERTDAQRPRPDDAPPPVVEQRSGIRGKESRGPQTLPTQRAAPAIDEAKAILPKKPGVDNSAQLRRAGDTEAPRSAKEEEGRNKRGKIEKEKERP